MSDKKDEVMGIEISLCRTIKIELSVSVSGLDMAEKERWRLQKRLMERVAEMVGEERGLKVDGEVRMWVTLKERCCRCAECWSPLSKRARECGLRYCYGCHMKRLWRRPLSVYVASKKIIAAACRSWCGGSR